MNQRFARKFDARPQPDARLSLKRIWHNKTSSMQPGLAASGMAPVDGEAAVSIGGRSAPVLYIGLAPGFAGLYQVNVVMPDALPPGEVNVTVSINGIAGLSATTIAAR